MGGTNSFVAARHAFDKMIRSEKPTWKNGDAMKADDFAAAWQDAWNSQDLDRIMHHYRDDIVFRSKKARDLVGAGEIHGKAALRDYWSQALARQPDLEFRVQQVFEGHDAIVICYINQRGVHAAETLYFDSAGAVFLASACHSGS